MTIRRHPRPTSLRPGATPISRRALLTLAGMGFGGIALADLMAQETDPGRRRGPRGPHHTPRARSVIWLFMAGGVSHMESFDPKPALTRFEGMSIAETPYADVLDDPSVEGILEKGLGRKLMQKIYPLQKGYRPRGRSGIAVSDWWPHVGACVDDLAVIRSMWTTDNNHQAQYQFHTGRNIVEGNFPSLGAWVHYGLGSLNENLPQFVVLGRPLGTCCGSSLGHGADYLGPRHAGVRLEVDPDGPLAFVQPEVELPRGFQANEFDLLGRLNRHATGRYPDDPADEARIRSYELAFRMQTAVPEVVSIDGEPDETLRLYGIEGDEPVDRSFARQCLIARRLVQRGTRFVQILHGAGGAGAWDAHSHLRDRYDHLCPRVDRPIAALLKDLKRIGLLDETLVVFGTEFGRTPGLEAMEASENREGRDHHPYGFSVWMAGGGVQGGMVHGATDELGFHAVEDRHYITDLHATILHQLGLESHRLDVPGRKRIEKDYGRPIEAILA